MLDGNLEPNPPYDECSTQLYPPGDVILGYVSIGCVDIGYIDIG